MNHDTKKRTFKTSIFINRRLHSVLQRIQTSNTIIDMFTQGLDEVCLFSTIGILRRVKSEILQGAIS